jgi:hypothetical protein
VRRDTGEQTTSHGRTDGAVLGPDMSRCAMNLLVRGSSDRARDGSAAIPT